MRKLLNVGGNSKNISLPKQYDSFKHILLDIDKNVNPDIICDARNLKNENLDKVDIIYCSHNLEHYYRHEVKMVLSGFLHTLKDGGAIHIRVPDMYRLMKIVIERNLDIDDVLYKSPSGPIMVLDVIYGHSGIIERDNVDYFSHKTGFTQKSLIKILKKSGFSKIVSYCKDLEVVAFAFKGKPDIELCEKLGLKFS